MVSALFECAAADTKGLIEIWRKGDGRIVMLSKESGWRAGLVILYALCVGSVVLRAQEGGANRSNSLPDGDGKAMVLGTCTQCHSLGTIVLQRKSAAQWGKTISDMISRGAQIPPEEIATITNYLAVGFGPDSPLPATGEKTSAQRNPAAAHGEQSAADALPDGSGKLVILRSCSECHGLSKITTQNKDEAGWLASVKDMVRLGAQLRSDEVTVVAAYLAKNFGRQPAPSGTGPSGAGPVPGGSGNNRAMSARADLSRLLPDGEGKGLILASCVQCHSLQEITGQRKLAKDWRHTVDDMVSRGAQVSSAEADLIATYLAERLGKGNK